MTGNEIRKLVIEMHRAADVGHVGPSLSIADLIAAVDPGGYNAESSPFILSKGHAASALYAALHLNGHISYGELMTYCQEGSRLETHPKSEIPYVPIATGSLGMGLGFGCGIALTSPNKHVRVLVSDAELNEGSTWESIMFAAHHNLSNLSLLIDNNNQQAFGKADDVLRIPALPIILQGFGWYVTQADGHNRLELLTWLERNRGTNTCPHALIANTTFGKGVSFMESNLNWHYFNMDDDEYNQARKEIHTLCETDLQKNSPK